MLKRFENLHFTLFSSPCPLYKQLYVIIKALREYFPNERAALQHNTKTIILWIFLLQAQIFSQGKMVGAKGCLGEFTNMLNQPTPNNGENISHIEVPTELLHQVEKQHNTSTKDGNNTRPQENKGNKYQGGQGGGDPKKPRSMHLWITKLREVWQKPLTDANYPLL